VVEHLHQGSRVIVIGRAETTAWPDRETGEKRTATRVIVDNHGTVGLALPTLTRNTRPDGVGGE
jgi:single-stranded DNA-binding protein